MKQKEKQHALYREIANCYDKETDIIQSLLKALGKLDKKVAKAMVELRSGQLQREKLIEKYSELLQNSNPDKKAKDLRIPNFKEIEEEYHSTLDNFNSSAEKVRKNIADISHRLQYSRSVNSSVERNKISLRERISNWIYNIQITYDEIYSA